MNYELIQPQDYLKLAPLFRQFNSTIPAIGTASIATENENVAGLLCLQPAFHVEPLVVLPSYRGKVDVVKLYHELMKALPAGTPHYSFVPDDNRAVAMIAGQFGLKPMGWSVWQGVS